jgi:hypothetical protein
LIALLATVGLAGLLLAAALAVPVDLEARASFEGELSANLRVGWLFGLVEREIEPSAERSQQTTWRPRREQLALLSRKPFRERVAQLYRRCRPAVEIGILSGQARFGLGDPAETGYAMGALVPILALLSQHPRIDLRVTPDWSEAVLEGMMDGRARVTPLGLVQPLVAFALSREVIATVRAWRRAKS